MRILNAFCMLKTPQEGPEQIILDKPHTVDALIAETVKEEVGKMRAMDVEPHGGVWPALHDRTMKEAIRCLPNMN